MELLLLSFLAGALTVLSPCVLPVLPVVLAGSAGSKDRRAPIIIISSLLVSVFLFTLLIKGTTSLIGVPTSFWLAVSGILVIAVGVSFLFPQLWEKIAQKIGLGSLSKKISSSAAGSKNPAAKHVLLGLSLGPIFTSCSPTYGIILATILPVSFLQGSIYIAFYTLGLSFILLLIAIGGQSITSKLGWATDPNGRFRKVVAIILILTGLLIATGTIKKAETWLVDRGFLGLSSLERSFSDSFETTEGASVSGVSIPSHLLSAFPNTDWSKADPKVADALSGGPGKDGIPAIDRPDFVAIGNSQERDEVQAIVLNDGDTKKVYPYSILNWHEIVNDTVDGTPVAVTFCPLCGSAIVFDRTLPDGRESTFGVSGSLLESNMIMYDRATETLVAAKYGSYARRGVL
jgi:cytochrome c biogenesis protein CcdA